MTEIVYNNCFGGFGLSREAVMRYAELKGIQLYLEDSKFGSYMYYTSPNRSSDSYFWAKDIDRTDPLLVQVVKELGKRANGGYAELAIAEVPAGHPYRITEYDGNESVVTPDYYDWKIA